MAERDDFELRVAAAVRAIAAEADTRIDAMSIAERARARAHAPVSKWVGALRWALLLAILVALLAATVILVGPGGHALLTDDATPAPGDPAGVVGRQACEPTGGPLTAAALLASGSVTCTESYADPRATGTSRFSLDAAETGAAGTTRPLSGDYRLDTTGGSWVGRFYGVPDAQGRPHLIAFTAGTGSYAGWSYVLAVGTTGDAQRVSGAIYPGALPPGYPVAVGEGLAATPSPYQAP
jgi:hypothetical protein